MTWVTIYTDGSFKNGVGGYAAWIRTGLHRGLIYGKVPRSLGKPTSNLAEGAALLAALEYMRFRGYAKCNVTVRTDSQWLIGQTQTRVNTTFNRKLREELKLWGRLKIKHVKGHRETKTTPGYLNDRVDGYARLGRGFKDYVPRQAYWEALNEKPT